MALSARQLQHSAPRRSDMLADHHGHAQEGNALPVDREPSSEVLTGATQLITKAAVTPEQADLLQVS